MSLAEAVIGFLAPPECVGCAEEGSALCLACRHAEIIPYGERCFSCGCLSPNSRTCPKCRRRAAPSHVWVATDYDGMAQKLVSLYKFGHQKAAAGPIAELMVDALLSHRSDRELAAANYIITFIPTATGRTRARGFDHAKLLAVMIGRLQKTVAKTTLSRRGQQQQIGARRLERFAQAAQAYQVKNPALVKGRNILLVDDVVTTGATLSAAARQLRLSGAKSVDALVFAKRLR